MDEKTFTILLKKAPDYKIIPGQTIYGGPLPDMSGVLMNVCVDHAAFPNYVTHPVDESGKVDTQTVVDQVQIANLEREMLCGIVLTLEQSKRLVNWLSMQIQNIEGRSNE